MTISPPTAPPTSPFEPLLEPFLRGRNAACPACGYNLRDLAAGVCPECGAKLHLQVGSDQLNLAPWICGMLSPALAIGFDGVVTILMSIALVLEPPRGRAQLTVVLAIVGGFAALAVSCGVLLAFVLARRRVWVRMRPAQQWRVAAAIFLGVFLVHAAFGGFLLIVL
jgi:hypothetical protein